MFRYAVQLILLAYISASWVEASKVGTCPAIPIGSVGACANLCTTDDDCSGSDKCCSNGCGQACMEPETYFLCQMYCPHGFILDTSGRPTCNCSQQTEIHEGECPVSDMVGLCAESCAHDGNCSTNQKCCSNGCGHECLDAVFPDKQGECPAFGGDSFGTCVSECQHDLDCSGPKKCCQNNCGRVCVDPTCGSSLYRPGTCPVGLLAEGTMGVCTELCENDLDCPTHHKCCSNGCGHVCMVADSLQVIHEGSCPASVSPNDQEIDGLCVEACDNDADCDDDQKCCTNGCGHLCMRALIESASCPEVMCMMWCPHGLKQDRDGCSTCECANQTVIHEGDCPVVAPDMMGTCMTTCEHDGSCETNEKCCSNGCAHTCQGAVITDTSKAGFCPATALSSETLGICSDLCSCDSDCDGTKKCCSNGCGHLCLEPETYPVHLGSCPIGDLPDGASGICSEVCLHDGQCGPNQKCCSNGCGHACITATAAPVGCPDVMCMLFCENGFQRDDGDCDICSCETPVGVHRGTCPVGLLPEGAVGICIEDCSNDTDCTETQKCCSNGCGHTCINVTTSRNVTDLCPDMMCLMWCEHGYQKDQNACDTCECNQQPVSCPDVLCALYCPYGNQLDENRCPMCACNERPDHCPDMMCMMYCVHGFERDQSGCEICTCSQSPEIRPGVCPPVSQSESLLQTSMCDNDGECPTNQKCCSDGRFYACVYARDVPQSCPEIMCMRYCPHGFKRDMDGCDVCECNSQSVIHEGECPIVLGGMVGICMEACEHDGNCSTNQKCCSNGCGHTCIDAVQSEVIKSGSCPVPDSDVTGTCDEQCADDTVCPGAQKCCSNGCGHACMDPDSAVVIRPGTCPIGALSDGIMGACFEGCDDDGDCSTNQKCCSNGCGHSCITVVEEPNSCPDVMCDMFCEFGFVRDEDGCNTCFCNEMPSVHLGSCPISKEIGGGFGICMDECYHDSDCSANQKCCSNGCGHTCRASVNAPVIHEGGCPVGNIPRGLLGLCAELCTDDSSCAANQKCCSNGCGHECIDMTPDCSDRVMCMMFCEHGYLKDSDGCDTCQCIEPVICPQVLCMMYCEHGTQKSENGCNTCVCNTEPVTCPPIICNMWCEGGFEQDQNGCDICRCQAQISCPQVMCMMYCENGFLRDENGCEICSCYTPPVVHPGSCTLNLLPQGSAGICIQGCGDDGACSTNQKCCSNGCGHVCMDAVLEPVRPGTCPVVRDGVFGVCKHMCGHDGECEGDKKCCSNGCGLSCVEPGPLPKPGMCPNQTNTGSFGICVNECEHDHGCTADQKCCHNGCGMTCRAPVPVSKPGECPAILSNTIGLCVEDCNNDAGCPGDFKCCINGCGHVCIDPSPDVSPLRTSSRAPPQLFAAPFKVLLITCMAILSMRI